MLEDVSACIIAKNEEKNLPRLLKSIHGKFFEIILVDTGSTDRTVDIAKEFGCKVFHKEWTGFADARNFAVDRASGKWIWHFDADTELEEEEYEKFKSFFTLVDRDIFEGISVLYKNTGKDGRVKSYSTTVHIHRKSENIRWIGKIHERVLNIENYTISIPPFKVKVLHHGYGEGAVQKDKARRNLNLIFKELRSIKDKKSIDYAINLFYAIQSFLVLAALEDREKNLKRSTKYIEKFYHLKDIFPKSSIFVKHFCVYASSVYLNLQDFENAENYINLGENLDEWYPDILYNKARLLEAKKDYEGSVSYYIKFLESLDNLSSRKDGVITDFMIMGYSVALEKLPSILKEQKFDDITPAIKEKWKKSRGLFIGLLFFSLISGNTDEAKKVLSKLSKIYNDNDVVYVIYSRILKEDNREKSLYYMQKAIELNPLSPDANLFFAELYREKGDIQNAILHYKNYLEVTKDIKVLPVVQELIKDIKTD